MPRRLRPVELPTPLRLTREDFVARYWDHRAGEHVTILGPSGWGKTTLAFDLLAPISTVDEPTIVLCMKSRDATVERFGKAHKFKRVRSWPPPVSVGNKRSPIRPPGFLLWPRFTGDPDTDEARQYQEFRQCMISSLRRGNGVKVFADEVADLNRMKLGNTVDYCIRQGRSMGMAVISATQRPFNAPGMVYDGAMHLFVGNNPDKRSQDRYEEIGNWDSGVVAGLSTQLNQYEWLYLRRPRDNQRAVMCIVGP